MDKEDEAVPQALIDASRRSFVVVNYHLQKDVSETAEAAERDYRINQLYDEYVDKKRPAELPGLVLDSDGRVLVVDSGLEDRFIQRIEVQAGGQTYPARRARLLFDAPAAILKVDPPGAAKLRRVRFASLEAKGVNTTLLQSSLYQADDEWRLRFAPLHPSLGLQGGGGENVYFGGRSGIQYDPRFGRRYTGVEHALYLIADANGAPVGCATTSFFDLQQAEGVWKGADLLRAAGMDWGQFQQAENACRSSLIAAVHEIVLVLRQSDEGEGRSYRYRSSGGAAGREISTYGLATSATEAVVLQQIDSKMARQIERLYVKDSPTRRQEVQFVGAFKSIGGFVVKLAKGQFPAWVPLAGEDPQRMRPFWMAHPRKRFGQKYVDLSTNRLYGKARGYRGEYHWYAARSIAGGTFLVDLKGRLVGAHAGERVEHEEERRLEAPRSYSGISDSYRIFTISELREMLAQPLAHVDPKVKVTAKTLARRRAWFGVEFVPMTATLAEMLKLESPTKDGQLGFLINAVYAGSPAEKTGLKVGDILLRLQAPGMPYPIDLSGRFAREEYRYRSRWYSSLEEEDAAGPVEPTWKSRQNFLTRALDAIGVDKTVRLAYFRPTGQGQGKMVTADYKIELAPPDQDSAAKWKNRKLGLTVKDVTYEVRHALNLKPPAGVIVATVESGSPAVIARIFPNELITRLDDQPLQSARQMRDLVAAARKAQKDKVRLTVLRLGKTRFADLSITEYDPADDEGLDEEP
jgi:S1-C subfamily serine protease